MYRLAAPDASRLPGDEVPAVSGAETELVAVLRSLRADDSCVVPLGDTRRLEEVDARLGAGPVAWAIEAARNAGSADVVASADGMNLSSPASAQFREDLLLDVLLDLAGRTVDLDDLARLQRDLSRNAAPHSGGLMALITALRGAQRFWTGLLLDHAVARSASVQVLREITEVVGARFDRLVDGAAARVAGREPTTGIRSDHRQHLVERLVAVEPVDPGALVAELGLDLGHPHLALVVTRRDEHPPQDDELDVAAGFAARAVGAAVALRHETADGALWVWLRSPAASGVPTQLGPGSFGPVPVRVGVGACRRGVPGLRRSHLEALDAHRIAAGPRGPVVRHEDVAFVTLLGRDPERARWFVASQLGPLAGEDEACEELRRTLSAYYGSGMRLATTAVRLHLHRNTLVNRLHRIEKLLGHPVTDRVAETHSALLLVEGAGAVPGWVS